jgi:UDP-N-acetylmuramoyl-tripeptide--D-alanyl-D-alanine ligase
MNAPQTPMFTVAQAAAMVPIFRVGSDTRTVQAGDLFVAIAGENFDGHTFAQDALGKGASAVLVARDTDARPAILCADSRVGFGELARTWRSQFRLPLIAVTGSNGKTTVTQMLAAILRAHAGDDAFATQGNLNNDIGVPLTLLRLRAHHCIGVVELGMNHPGEIATLAQMAQPTVALVNNAQREHQEFMKSVADVAAENGSVFHYLPVDGVAVINHDDAYAGYWKGMAAPRRVLTFGLHAGADVTATVGEAAFGAHLHLRTPQGAGEAVLRIAGEHNVRNALAACACALAAGVPLDSICRGLGMFEPVKGRLVKKVSPRGAVVIDDTYNANPDSVRAAIDVLAALQGERLLVLGRMGEVGDQGPAFHHEVGAYARERGIQSLMTVGEETAPCIEGYGAGAQRFADVEALSCAVRARALPGTTILVKGARSAKMERIVESIMATNASEGLHHAAFSPPNSSSKTENTARSVSHAA